jgi:hypothetical protein
MRQGIHSLSECRVRASENPSEEQSQPAAKSITNAIAQ